VVATRSLPPPSPPTGKASGFWESIGWFYDAAFAKFMVPLQWYVDTTSLMGKKVFEVWTCSTFVTIIFFPVMFNLLVIWTYSLLAFYLPFMIGMYILFMGSFVPVGNGY
jgi:hypothetical protein